MDVSDDWFHVFLCYKSEDFAAAEALRATLVSRGQRVFLDVIEGEIWAPLSRSIEQALARSRTLVALVTKNFPVSPHCREELHVALSAAYQLDEGETSRVMAVVQGVSADEVRPTQLTTYRLPHSGLPSAELAKSIVRNVAAHDRLIGDAPAPPSPKWYPREQVGDRFFRGRYAELWDIHTGLRAREKNRDRGKPVVAVSGLGGQGKTSLCLQYARLFARDHPGGVFVLDFGGSDGRAESGNLAVEVRFREHLESIAEYLGVSDPEIIAAGLERFGQQYLWILDDVPATTDPELLVRMYAPTQAGRTLITTRGRFDRFVSQSCPLGPLGAQVGAAVLTALQPARRDERDAVREVVRLLGEHPLGLTLAAGLTTNADFGGYRALLADLSSTVPDRLENADLQATLPTGSAGPFSRVLLRSFDSLDTAGQDVLCAASVLAPAVIPPDLLAGMVLRVSGTRGVDPAGGVAQGVARGLLSASGEGYTMHAVVARAVRVLVRPPSYRARLRDAALVELTEAVERTQEGYRHAEVLRHVPHVRAVVGLLTGGDDWAIGRDELHLANETGRTLIESGQTGEALAHSRAMYEACEAAGVDWYTRSVALFGLATAYGLEGEYSKALSLKEEVYELFADKLGAGAPATLTALNNVAVSHMDVGLYEEAHASLCAVYRGRRDHRRMGPTDRDTLIALNNLAIARGHLGVSPAERERHRRVAHRYWLASWESWQRIARPGDQYPLDALNGLALSYRALGMPQEALALMTDLHRQRSELLGRDHPDTLGALENKLVLREEIRERGR